MAEFLRYDNGQEYEDTGEVFQSSSWRIFLCYSIVDDYEGEKNGELLEVMNDFLNHIEDFDH